MFLKKDDQFKISNSDQYSHICYPEPFLSRSTQESGLSRKKIQNRGETNE